MEAGAPLARIAGPAQTLLRAERTALNLLQHLSGIATLTRAYVNRLAGTKAVRRAQRILLENMDLPTLRRAVELVAGRAQTEASGEVSLETIAAIAQSGVDYVSVGRIIQLAPAVNIGLDWTPQEQAPTEQR